MVFNQLFGTFNKDVISECQYYTGCLPLCYLLDMKTIFLHNLGDLQDINFSAYWLLTLTGIDELQTCSAHYKATIKYKLWSKFAVQSGH